jgi:hypothetical protein
LISSVAATDRRAAIAVLCASARRRAQTSPVVLPGEAWAGLDWEGLFRLADAHGVTELLTTPLSAGAVTVPPAVVADLKRRELEATGLNLNRTTQLVGLLQLLAAHQIPALTFKGPALAHGIYGHIGRRVSNDIDILIHHHDAARVRELLLADGYQVPPRDPQLGASLIHGLIPSAGRDDTLVPGRPGLASVDVHVAFAYWTMGIRLDVRAMFDRAAPVRISGQTVPTLCPDDLLLVLAIHGMMHGWHALRLVSDVDAVVDVVTDWDAVWRRAEDARMTRVLQVALLLSEELLGTSLPSVATSRTPHDTAAADIARTAAARMFDPHASAAHWNHHRWLLEFLDGPGRRLGYHARSIIERVVLGQPWNGWLGRREAKDT